MSDPRFDKLRAAGIPVPAVALLERHVETAPPEELARVNPLAFAEAHGLQAAEAIDLFLHASRLGLFDLNWNVLCHACGGILETSAHLQQGADEPNCSLCAIKVRPTLDEMFEVSFTVSPAVRPIPAHHPESLPIWDYMRQIYFSHALKMPSGAAWSALVREICVADCKVEPGTRIALDLDLAAQFLILFDPVHHLTVFLDVKGERAGAPQHLEVLLAAGGAYPGKVELRPGPLRLTIDNHLAERALVGLFTPSDAFHHGLERRPYLTGKQLLSNQTFRDLFRGETLKIDERLRITSLTVLFTDLKGSTALYEKVGDLLAYDLVRDHFKVLGQVVRKGGGAVVKTIGDAVMATFPTPELGLACALAMRDAMDALNRERGDDKESLELKIGLHSGPCLAVTLNDRLDYFGQAVNIAARVQGLADSRSIFATQAVVQHEPARRLLEARGLPWRERRAQLKGVSEAVTVYEVP